jgi:hypothetical protein
MSKITPGTRKFLENIAEKAKWDQHRGMYVVGIDKEGMESLHEILNDESK